MPQVILGRNYGNNEIGASQMQNNAYLNASRKAEERRKNADQALNKAVSFMQKYGAAKGSEITNVEGAVNANTKMQEQMRPKKEDLSRNKEMSFQRNIVRTSQDKMNEMINNGSTLLNRKPFEGTNFTDKDEVFQKAAGGQIGGVGDALQSATVKLMESLGIGGSGGKGGSASLKKGESESGSASFTAPSITGAGHDYEVLANTQQAFRDNFGYDTKSARMLADFEEIGALASGRQYDPNKDVYLQGALQRDKDLNEANAKDIAVQAALSKALDRGSDGGYSGGGVSASHSRGYDAGSSTNIITNNDLGGGGDPKNQEEFEDILYTDSFGNITKETAAIRTDGHVKKIVAKPGTFHRGTGIIPTNRGIDKDAFEARILRGKINLASTGFQSKQALEKSLYNKRDRTGQENALKGLIAGYMKGAEGQGEITMKEYNQNGQRIIATYIDGEPDIALGFDANNDFGVYMMDGGSYDRARDLNPQGIVLVQAGSKQIEHPNIPPSNTNKKRGG